MFTWNHRSIIIITILIVRSGCSFQKVLCAQFPDELKGPVLFGNVVQQLIIFFLNISTCSMTASLLPPPISDISNLFIEILLYFIAELTFENLLERT